MPKRGGIARANQKWMSTEEAIAQIMRSTGCDTNAAREKLAEAVRDGKIGWKQYKESMRQPPWLEGEEAARLFKEAPEDVVVPFSELLKHCTWQELLGELRSGRLRAFPLNESAMLLMQLSQLVEPDYFAVTGTELLAWLSHPDTPPALKRKIVPRRELQ
jgi:hypothetical protein